MLLVIGGPNGAGKTTVTVKLRAERWSEGVEYINPDDIAQDRFGDWNSPVRLLYVGTGDPRINAARVADHVMRGGHTMPIDKIITRYKRSLEHRSLGDLVLLLPPLPEQRELIARLEEQLARIDGPAELVRRQVERLHAYRHTAAVTGQLDLSEGAP